MSDWRDDDVEDEGSRTSSELLDLVRNAEEEARIPTRQAPPSSAAHVVEADELLPPDDEPEGDVVDVGDEAVEAPPSRPTPPPASEAAPRKQLARAAPPSERALPPLVGIALLFALIGAVLALVAR